MKRSIYILLLVVMYFFVEGREVLARTYTADMLTVLNKPLVGKDLSLVYEVAIPVKNLRNEDVVFESSPSVLIKNVLISPRDTGLDNESRTFTQTSIYMIEMQLLVASAGVHIIPYIVIGSDIVTFPYLVVPTILEEDNLQLISIFEYVPIKELIYLIPFFILALGIIILTVILIRYLHKEIRRIIRNYGNFVNVYICMSRINMIIKQLQRTSNGKRRKYLLTKSCYEKLLFIIRKRINFLAHNSKGNARTPEEIAELFMRNIPMDEPMTEQIREVFYICDEALYGNKKIPVKKRVEHCNICKSLLLSSYKYHIENKEIFNNMYDKKIYLQAKENDFNVFQ